MTAEEVTLKSCKNSCS